MTATPGAPGPSDATTGSPRRRGGGPPLWFALLGAGGLLVGVLMIAAQVLDLGTGGTSAPATLAPAGQAAAATRGVVVEALEAAAFQVRDPLTPYRPGESPALYAVPRVVIQAVLPSDPTGGYVVIYELEDNVEADGVGRDFAAYLASGTGAIQYPRDSRFVLRRVGRTLVFFPWSPAVSPDPEVARMATTLDSIGQPVGG